MIDWDAERIAAAAGAELARENSGTGTDFSGPARVVIDSREVQPGDLFVGLAGERADGGSFAAAALAAGAWGVLVGPPWRDVEGEGAVLVADSPLAAMQSLAREWRRALAVPVIAITGSVGKTSTKDVCAALLRAAGRRVHASRENFNTEIGLPLELLAAPADTQVLVLELAMRGAGQIAELAEICEPDVGVITNVGPVHVELLGSVEAVARAKAELLAGLAAGGVGIVPAVEPLLDGLVPAGVEIVRVGEDVRLDGLHVSRAAGRDEAQAIVAAGEDTVALTLPFSAEHMLTNTLFAYAAARAVGAEPSGAIEFTPSALRGERIQLAGGALVLNDCYNANPLSMRAALSDLASQSPEGRRIAVLGDMLELGPDEAALHREIGAAAADAGVDVLVTVGPLAAEMRSAFPRESHAVPDAAAAAALAAGLVGAGDVVLVKASRGIGLEVVAQALLERDGAAA